MTIWQCQSCGYQYDPARGDRETGLVPGAPFEMLPRDWRCPRCGASRYEFDEVVPDWEDDADLPPESTTDPPDDEPIEDFDDLEDEDPEAEDEEVLEEAFGTRFIVDEDDLEDFEEDNFEDTDGEFEGAFVYQDDDLEDEYADDEAFEDDEFGAHLEDAGDETVEDGRFDEGDIEEDEDDPDDGEDDPGARWDAPPDSRDLRDDDTFGEEGDPDGWDELDSEDSTRYNCWQCGWIYDPGLGYLESGIGPGTLFCEVPSDWKCPSCGASKKRFRPIEDAPGAGMTPGEADVLLARRRAAGAHGSMWLPPCWNAPKAGAACSGLEGLLFVPGPLFPEHRVENVTTITQIGRCNGRSVRLSTPILLSPDAATSDPERLRQVVSRAAAKVGAGCTSGIQDSSKVQRRASGCIVEHSPAREPLPTPEMNQAALLRLAWPWAQDLAAPLSISPPTHVPPLPLPLTLEAIRKNFETLREQTSGPVGLRLPAGRIEADLERLLPLEPDFLVIDGHPAGEGSLPDHLRSHALLPTWLAVVRARDCLRANDRAEISLIASGGLYSTADVAKVMALGADAVLLAASIALLATGHLSAIDVQTGQFVLDDSFRTTEKLGEFLQRVTRELSEYCLLVGKSNPKELDESDLAAGSSAPTGLPAPLKVRG